MALSGPTWTIHMMEAQAKRVLALTRSGYSAWIRQAIEERLERDEPKKE